MALPTETTLTGWLDSRHSAGGPVVDCRLDGEPLDYVIHRALAAVQQHPAQPITGRVRITIQRASTPGGGDEQ